jgi:hypothetical protein
MLDRRRRGGRITLGADKAHDVTGFIGDLRQHKVTPHSAVNGAASKLGKSRKAAILATRSASACPSASRTCSAGPGPRAGFGQVKVRGRPGAEAVVTFAATACNLIRLPKLLAGLA